MAWSVGGSAGLDRVFVLAKILDRPGTLFAGPRILRNEISGLTSPSNLSASRWNYAATSDAATVAS